MRAGLDKNVILKAAADMADKHGVANVTLKALAEELGYTITATTKANIINEFLGQQE